MAISLSDVLLRDVHAERSDAWLLRVAGGGAILVPKSEDVVAHYVLEGRVMIEAGNAMAAPATLREGEFALLFYGTDHRLSLAGDTRVAQTQVIRHWPAADEPEPLDVGSGKPRARLLSAALRIAHNPSPGHPHNPMPDIVHLRRDAADFFGNRVVSIRVGDEAAFRGPGASAFVNALMNVQLTQAFRCANFGLHALFPEMRQSPYLMRSEGTRGVATAVRLMNAHPEKDWSIAGLAREVGQSRSVFAARFREHIGKGPMEYLTDIRLKMAAELLMEVRFQLSLTQVAQMIGYGSASAFARAFKTRYGLSPRLYARQAAPGS